MLFPADRAVQAARDVDVQRHAVAQAEAARRVRWPGPSVLRRGDVRDAVGRADLAFQREAVAQREAADRAQVDAACADAAAGVDRPCRSSSPDSSTPKLSVTMLPAGQAVRGRAARAGQSRHVAARRVAIGRACRSDRSMKLLPACGARIADILRQAGLRRLRAGPEGDPERRHGDGAMGECTKVGGHLSVSCGGLVVGRSDAHVQATAVPPASSHLVGASARFGR